MVVKIKKFKHYEPWMVEKDNCVFASTLSLVDPNYAF